MKMKKIVPWGLGALILLVIIGFSNMIIDSALPNPEESNGEIIEKTAEINEEEVLETLTISCDGPAGESFPLFKGAESYEITSRKITCKKPIEVLERTCVLDIDSYTLEIDKVRQGDLVGWAMRKDLKCKSIYCDSALDSICNERT